MHLDESILSTCILLCFAKLIVHYFISTLIKVNMAMSKIFLLAIATIMWQCGFGLQRPPPRYSQQYMPQTTFSCRNKIIGSYYADPETDCQLFHVCVSVGGSIQDYRFLCPNDTAFDQESQTCADWYDVDCEAATLYYASDNFDLYRIGSGLESLHYDNIRSDFEPQDHLQRSESNDPIRSPLKSYNSYSTNYKENDNKNNNVRANDDYLSKNHKNLNTDIEKDKIIDENRELQNKSNLRKVNRKFTNNALTNVYTTKLVTTVPVSMQGRYIEKSFEQKYAYSTTNIPTSQIALNTHKTNHLTPTSKSTTTKYTTDLKTNSQDTKTAKPIINNNLNNYNRFEMTAKPTNVFSTYYPEKTYSNQVSLVSPSTMKHSYKQDNSYEIQNKNNNNYNNDNNISRIDSSSYITTTEMANFYKSNKNSYNLNHSDYQSLKSSFNQNTYTVNTYAPTTYSPVTKKFASHRQHTEKLLMSISKSPRNTEVDNTKKTKSVTSYKNYQNFETSTRNYNFGKSSIGLGFSPSSVNHLAENIRSTTPSPRQSALPTTYNPNSFNGNQQKLAYTTTTKFLQETTNRPKVMKKNDYDYAYYDNAPLEYDNIELEHVGSNKESVKIK